MTSIQASIAELENLDNDVKGKGTRTTILGRNTDALSRGGLARSSNEVHVMGMERRSKRIIEDSGQPGNREDLVGLYVFEEPCDMRVSSTVP
jgi:hypothetical protein